MTQILTAREASTCDQRFVKISGAVQAGKTEALIQRCIALLKDGVDGRRILVVAANASAAQVLRERLEWTAENDGGKPGSAPAQATLVEAARRVRVSSVRSTCLEALDSQEAREATGRIPRVLNDAEMVFLLEDLKARGIAPSTLRGSLALFSRSWENLHDEAAWRLDATQAEALGALHAALDARQAMLEQEVAFTAAGLLADRAGKGEQAPFDYVLCDDFQNLCAAEQSCMALLAQTQLMVVGNAQQTVAVHSKNPCARGFAEFEHAYQGAFVAVLPNPHEDTAIGRFAHALTAFGDMPELAPGADAQVQRVGSAEEDPGRDLAASAANRETGEPPTLPSHLQQGVVSVKWNTPDDEERGLFAYLQALKKAGCIEADRDVVVVVPNARWARMAQKALARRGFATNTLGLKVRIGGDPREAQRCPALAAYTKLNLLAHPEDVVAWRSWCGIGDEHLSSAAWTSLEDHAAEQGLAVLEVLEALAAGSANDDAFEGARDLAARYEEGKQLVAQLQGRRGFALVSGIGADKLPEFSNVYQTLAGDEGPERVFELERDSLFDPELPEKLNAVRIADPSSICGLSAPVVVVAGAVEGFFPSSAVFDQDASEEARTARLNNERRMFYSLAGKARTLLVLSFFAKADKQLAEAGRMRIARSKQEHGRDIALVRQSTFLTEGDSQLSGTIGGQQLLASLD